ncbi:hypothetical protein HRR76_005393 [Exophiala dermatitidis]|nr:hypothetical protein HRR77_009127 [Exophiala dermatitidis]KAJ4537383.1 hypothetical protein HRR76_005393 [Exophiala dermatitidis]KAJ4571311.1 hypothetical protein HRR82_007308 [Exophiala dermatitidis]KAJ4690209.1 hypothetical protein HRR87_008714 [Exophiala dermatitidis]KAJ9000028.1 hypothetical protein HRR94_005206 [Exophiala dermatitidis]
MNGTTVQALSTLHEQGWAPRISITVNTPTPLDAGGSQRPSNGGAWSPLQELSGVVSLTSREPLTIKHAQISFEGETRVHTQSVSKEDQRRIVTRKSRYKFLTQSLDLDNLERSNPPEAGFCHYSSQFHFIISKIVAVFTDSHATGGAVKVSDQLEIHIQAGPEVFPPCDTEDWFSDLVTKQSHSLRPSIFSFQKYTMNVIAHEPSPVLMVVAHPFETTEVVIRVVVTASPRNVDIGAFATFLQRIGFKIIPGLRAKTFYSTQPFPKLPAQALLTVDGPHRLHDQILKLEQVDRSLTSWRLVATNAAPLSDRGAIVRSTIGHKIHPPRSDPTPPAEWHSEISFSIKLPNDVTPTFCSAIAARQYSLIILLKASGISIENFVLEVPIQLVSAPTLSNSVYWSDSGDGLSNVYEPEHLDYEQDSCKVIYDDPPPKYI